MSTLEELVPAFLAILEGCKLTAYQDTGGVWTIGFGDTGPDVIPGLKITQSEADSRLLNKCKPLIALVEAQVGITSTVAQMAYVSFGYNCGSAALQRVLAGEDTIMNPRHHTDKLGSTLSWLLKRRLLENLLSQL